MKTRLKSDVDNLAEPIIAIEANWTANTQQINKRWYFYRQTKRWKLIVAEFSEHYILPAASTSSPSGVRLEFPSGILLLHFDYDKEGIVYHSGLRFERVRAHRHVTELHCPAWKIESSYDRLVQISDSKWITELLDSTPDDQRNSWKLNHYMIYFDSDGCYEIVAETWSDLPEKTGSL